MNWPPLPSRDWLAAEELPPKQVLDWDRWLGPAPWRPYHSSYVRGGWRNFYDFHGGGILEWGSHTVDLCQWAAELDDTQPVEYEPVGTNVGPYQVHCKYAERRELVMRDDGWDGSLKTGSCSFRIEGDQGWVETGDATKIECSDNIKPLLRPTESASLALENHMGDCCVRIKDATAPRASAAAAANSHVICHAAFIAYQRGKTLTWDPAKREFTNDEIAQSNAVARVARAVASLEGEQHAANYTARTRSRSLPNRSRRPNRLPNSRRANISTMDAAGADPHPEGCRIRRSFRRRKRASEPASWVQRGSARAGRLCSADEHLSAYARYGLEPIADPSADDALRAALAKLQGNQLIGVINSIGKRRDAKAGPALAKNDVRRRR